METWATHLPILAAFAARTQGPVLEMGTGYYSTPVLHGICHLRRLVSIDNNGPFMQQFLDLRSPFHEFHHVPDWNAWDGKLIETPWDVAFVDHAPGERRAIDIEKLRRWARFIVVHDTHPDAVKELGFEPLFSSFRYRLDYTRLVPWTTVLSDKADPCRVLVDYAPQSS